MKKLFTCFLALTLLLTPVISVSATTPDTTGDSVFSNRYYYKTVTYDRFLSGTYKITPEDIENEGKARALAQYVVSKAGIPGDIVNLTYDIGMAIYDMNEPGTVYTYRTVKEKIRVDDLTKEEQVVETWWTVEFKLYDTHGEYYNGHIHTIRIK